MDLGKQKKEKKGMKIIKTADYNEMSRKAANLIGAQVIMKPNCILAWQQDLLRLELTKN